MSDTGNYNDAALLLKYLGERYPVFEKYGRAATVVKYIISRKQAHAFFPVPPLLIKIPSGGAGAIDPWDVLERAVTGLKKIPSIGFPGREWRIAGAPVSDTSPNQPATLVVDAVAKYKYATFPAAGPQTDMWTSGVLRLRLRAALNPANDFDWLTLQFEDELGWLFDEARDQMIHTTYTIFRTLMDWKISSHFELPSQLSADQFLSVLFERALLEPGLITTEDALQFLRERREL